MRNTLLLSVLFLLIVITLAWNRTETSVASLPDEEASNDESTLATESVKSQGGELGTRPRSTVSARSASSQVEIIAAAAALVPSTQASFSPLPDPSAKLVDSIGILAANAEAGDVRAATRLAHEVKCCQSLPGLTYAIEQWVTIEARMTQVDQESKAKIKQLITNDLIELDRFCGAVGNKTLREYSSSNQRLVQLLRDRDPATRLRWLRNPELHEFRIQGVRARIEALQAYERNALSSLYQLIAGGNLDAVATAAAIHATPTLHGDLGSLVQQDWYTTAVYNHLYVLAGGRAYRQRIQGFINERLPRVLTVAELSQAKAEANTLFDRYFRGKQTSEYGTHLVGLSPETGFQPPPVLSIERKCPTLMGFAAMYEQVARTNQNKKP